MNQHLDFITLGATDLVASRRFYVDGLGWTPCFEVPGDVFFMQLGHGLTLSVWSRDKLLAEGGGGASSGVPPISLSSNEPSEEAVDAAYSRALAAGATPLTPPTRAEWGGYSGYVADPDGFRWEIAHNPGWRVEPDGTVHLGAAAPD
jgi:catechol 2,3-dioxygenase-like lactoylglutathione lyase family enzyme